MGLGLCPEAAQGSCVTTRWGCVTRSAHCTAAEAMTKRLLDLLRDCRYNQNPQLLMGLMKGQLPGKRLCERGLAALVDTSLNLHLKYAFMAKNNNSLQANCCQKVELREAFLLLYSALVRQFWTDGSSCGLPRAKNTRPYRSELREGPQRQLKGWSPSIMR